MKDFDIKPEWRTSTVLGLCRAMRESQEFDALPILADALQDADCDDEGLLARLRGGPYGYAEIAKLVALVLTEDAFASVAWLEDMAAALGGPEWYDRNDDVRRDKGLTFASLLEAGRDYCQDDSFYLHMGTNEDYKSVFYGKEKEFWRHWQLVTGIAAKDPDASFFSCSC